MRGTGPDGMRCDVLILIFKSRVICAAGERRSLTDGALSLEMQQSCTGVTSAASPKDSRIYGARPGTDFTFFLCMWQVRNISSVCRVFLIQRTLI